MMALQQTADLVLNGNFRIGVMQKSNILPLFFWSIDCPFKGTSKNTWILS